jgi:hypothetical protein
VAGTARRISATWRDGSAYEYLVPSPIATLIYPPYYAATGADITGSCRRVTQLTRTPTIDEFRAFILLHEVGHLTNANSAYVPGDIGYAFNVMLVERCLGILRRPL